MSTAYKPYRRADDFGTPASRNATDKTVTLTIDGEEVTVPEGTTVLRAAALTGVNIPKLCATDSASSLSAPAVCVSSRSRVPRACPRRARPRFVRA